MTMVLTPRQVVLLDVVGVACTHKLTLDHIFKRDRRIRVVNARNAAFWAIWFNYGFSLPKLGRLFGRSHASVLRGIGSHMLRCGIDHPWATLYAAWRETLVQKARKRNSK